MFEKTENKLKRGRGWPIWIAFERKWVVVGCWTVGKGVASDNRWPKFKSSHRLLSKTIFVMKRQKMLKFVFLKLIYSNISNILLQWILLKCLAGSTSCRPDSLCSHFVSDICLGVITKTFTSSKLIRVYKIKAFNSL